jgi:hypothetical protein
MQPALRFLQGVKLVSKLPPESQLMVQPPADHSLGMAALCHYTWGSIFKDKNDSNREVWKFDKRFFTSQTDALKVSISPQHISAVLHVVVSRMHCSQLQLPRLCRTQAEECTFRSQVIGNDSQTYWIECCGLSFANS